MKREKPKFFCSREVKLPSDRKGTEKPIEIFVALFIILAVALVMLKLFQGQIADQQKKIVDIQEEQKSRETVQKVRQACTDKCVDASNNGCSLASMAALCTYGSKNVLGKDAYIDLNNDKKNDYDETLLAGIGVCEDAVFCFHVVGSCCAQEIDADACKDILTRYWTNKMPSGTDLDDLLANTVDPGICKDPDGGAGSNPYSDTVNPRRWDTLAAWPDP